MTLIGRRVRRMHLIAYVTSQGTNSVTPIEVATHTAGTPIPVGSSPVGIAITPAW